MQQKLILITGATDGIGKQTALELARGGARLLLHGRNQSKLEATRDELQRLVVGSLVEIVTADFSSLSEVRGLAEDVAARHGAIDVLVNNAGVYMNQLGMSRDGHEMTFAVNHLAPFLLTHLLLDALRAAPRARIVNVSSVAHMRGVLDFENLRGEKGFAPYGAYALSKLANVLFTVELARRLDGAPITVNALHPGVVSTKLLIEGFGMQGSDSLSQGAATSVYLATSPEVADVSGRYFVRCREAEMNPVAAQAGMASRFYELSAELTGIRGLPAA
jgi:NAD(P)-dependent dehydrogenase (short-subunit alcohol dehydrogenase family)